MNYMIKKKYEAAGGSVNSSKMDISGAKSIRNSVTRPQPGALQLRPTTVASQMVANNGHDTPQLGKKNIQNDNYNDSYLFEPKPVSKLSSASGNPYNGHLPVPNPSQQFNAGKSSGVWAAGGITGDTSPPTMARSPLMRYDDQSGIQQYAVLSGQMKKQAAPTEVSPSALGSMNPADAARLKTDFELLKRKYEILLDENEQLKQQNSKPSEDQRGQQLLKSELDQAKSETNMLKSENQKLRIKNQTLMEEIGKPELTTDLLNNQRNELMMINDQSKVHIESEAGLKKQVDYLTEKMKEYRTKSNNVDALLMENDNLKLKIQAMTAAEASYKSVGGEVDHLRQENKTLKVKNAALMAENGNSYFTRFDQ